MATKWTMSLVRRSVKKRLKNIKNINIDFCFFGGLQLLENSTKVKTVDKKFFWYRGGIALGNLVMKPKTGIYLANFRLNNTSWEFQKKH